MSIWLSTTLAAMAAAAPSSSVETFEYEIQKGDTCAGIATTLYGDRRHHEVIHRYNRWLGAQLPHHLEEGQKLTLPKTLPPAAPDAELTAARRRVEARAPETSDWSGAAVGLDLFRGWRVNTHEQASAEITFRDDSLIEMRQNTLVIIYGGSRDKARRQTSEATLDRGALRSRLGAYTGGKADRGVTVTTPSAVAELEGGVSLVTVDDGGTSRVANHGTGRAAVRSSKKRGRKVRVEPKMGSKVAKGKAPTKPKPLPPTPSWIERGPTTFVAAGDRGGTIYGEWGAIANATSYRVEVSRQADGRGPIANQTVSSGVHRFEAQQLPPGDYYVSVAAIDDDAFESPPSDPRRLSVVAVNLLTPGGAPLPVDSSEESPEPGSTERVLRGTRLDVPRGLRCRVDGGELSTEPMLTKAGTHAVDCMTEDDQLVPGFEVTVVEVKVAASATQASAIRGQTAEASFSVDAEVPLPKRLWVEAPDGFLVGSPTFDAATKQWTVRVHADDDAPADAELIIMADAAGSEVELGRMPLAIADPVETAPTAVDPETPSGSSGRERHMVEAGIFGGVFVPSTNHRLYQETVVDWERLRPAAGSVGLRLGYYPIRYVGVELENELIPTQGRDSGERATLYSLRAHAVGQGPWRVTPTLHVGGGAIGVGSPSLGRDIDPLLYFGGGVKFFATRWLALRLDARDLVTEARDEGMTHSLEVQLGLSVVLGRKSTGVRKRGR